MFLSKIKRHAGRLIILSLLVVGLIGMPLTPAERTVKAFITCEECEQQFEECQIGCIDQPSACMTFCNFQRNRCLRNCQ